MKDQNGTEIKVGSRAVMLRRKGHDHCGLNGRIGTVRDVRPAVGALGGKAGLRIAEGPEGDPTWSAWVTPEEITVIPEPATV